MREQQRSGNRADREPTLEGDLRRGTWVTCGRRPQSWIVFASVLAVLGAPVGAIAGSREAVAVLLAPTVLSVGSRSRTPPLAPRTRAAAAETVRHGERLFAHHCASCHGRAAEGDGLDAALFDPRPPALTGDLLKGHPDAALVARIRGDRARALALDPAALRGHATDVEAIAAHLERLPTVDWRVVERGQEIYVDRCALCHGPYGRPDAPPPPGVGSPRDLSDPAFQRARDDDELRAAVRHGFKGMPALVPRISEADARAVAAFVRLLSPGFERYTRYCAACHGDDGRGAGSFAEAQRLPSVVFDRAYFARHDPEQVRSAVWHMLDEKAPRMPHLRKPVSARDAAAIVTYLRARL
jgi:mono/diheme cytochrome c family protein